MRTDTGVALWLAIALGCAWPSATLGEATLAETSALNQPTVSDVLERIERYQRVQLQELDNWRQGLERMNTVVAELELALLEVYGPEPVRHHRRGLERMSRLHQGEAGHLSEDVRHLLRVLATQQQSLLKTEAGCRELESELAEERHEHRETQNRLRALRMIERQLEDTQSETAENDGRDVDGRR